MLFYSAQPVNSETTWNNDLKARSTFRWKAEKAELRDLQNSEQYQYGIGGNNVLGGDNEIYLLEQPKSNFDFIVGDQLNVSITVEGDIGVYDGSGDFQDWSLSILPIEVNGTRFFDILAINVELVENLTNAQSINNFIDEDEGFWNLKYNGTYHLEYVWDLKTGLLKSKTVTSESGFQLRIVQGKGSISGLAGGIFNFSIIPVIIVVMIVGYVISKEG